jgi:hypothetical protein
MLVSTYFLRGRFVHLSILSLSLFTARFGGLVTRSIFLLLIRLRLLGAWFDGGLFGGRLRLSSWLVLDAS